MLLRRVKYILPSLALAGFVVSCETTAEATPATLASADSDTMEYVRSVLADALGRAQINFGAGDPTSSPVISVLPPRPVDHEGRSLATPEQFDIFMQGSRCYVRRRKTGDEYSLRDIDCRPL